MKKMFLGLAAVALIATSCTKDVTIAQNGDGNGVVGFDMSTGKTRATIVNIGGLQNDAAGFGVYAENTAAPTMFIDNEAYTYNQSGSKWGWANSPIMWPTTNAGFPINFYAYYPKNITLTSALTANHTVNATTATQVDLLAANQLNVVARPASSNVSLDFKHILSKIDFKIVTGAAVTVEVQSIAIKHVGNAGTFDYSTLAWSTAPSVFTSNYDYMVAPVANANKFVGQTTAANVTGTSGSMMLMPQDLTALAWDLKAGTIATGTYIEVVYRVYETATGKDLIGFTDATQHPNYTSLGSTVTGSLFVKVGYALPTNWLMGKGYTYTIYLGTADASGGNLTDDNFMEDDGTDSGLPIVIDGETKNVPDPITDQNKPIGFVVSVDNWDDQTPSIDVK